jgi:DNA/RNA-binding domain of Phe-tRNA-synthetase-like protein
VTVFSIQPAIFDLFPGVCIAVAIASGVDNSVTRPAIEAGWRAAWTGAGAAAEYGNAQSHPRAAPWRECFRAMGISGKEFPSSVEALLRRALKGGEPFQVSPLVDFYNAVSLRHFVPAGAFDLDEVEGDIALRLTRAGDTFWPFDGTEAVDVSPGEVAYADRENILTRHFVWRQAQYGLIGAGTRRVMLLAEVLGEIGPEVAQAVLQELLGGLRDEFGVEAERASVADARNPVLTW